MLCAWWLYKCSSSFCGGGAARLHKLWSVKPETTLLAKSRGAWDRDGGPNPRQSCFLQHTETWTSYTGSKTHCLLNCNRIKGNMRQMTQKPINFHVNWKVNRRLHAVFPPIKFNLSYYLKWWKNTLILAVQMADLSKHPAKQKMKVCDVSSWKTEHKITFSTLCTPFLLRGFQLCAVFLN